MVNDVACLFLVVLFVFFFTGLVLLALISSRLTLIKTHEPEGCGIPASVQHVVLRRVLDPRRRGSIGGVQRGAAELPPMYPTKQNTTHTQKKKINNNSNDNKIMGGQKRMDFFGLSLQTHVPLLEKKNAPKLREPCVTILPKRKRGPYRDRATRVDKVGNNPERRKYMGAHTTAEAKPMKGIWGALVFEVPVCRRKVRQQPQYVVWEGGGAGLGCMWGFDRASF